MGKDWLLRMDINKKSNRLLNFMGLHPHVAELDLRNIMVVDSTHLATIILPASSNQSIVHSGKDSESVCLEVGLRE